MEPEKINDTIDYLDTVISYVLKKKPSIIETWKQEVEGQGKQLQNVFQVFENNLIEWKKRPTGTLLAKLIWIKRTYFRTPGNEHEGLMAWNDFIMNNRHDNDRDLNAVTSQREIINFLMDKGITIEEIERLQDKNTLRGKGNAKEINRKIFDEVKKKVIENIKNKPELLKGFACPHLAPETVEEIYNLMAEKQISGKPEHFKAIFSQTPQTVTEPVKWLKKSQRRDEKGRYRGHQTMLHLFIKTMLQRNLTADEKRKTSKLFIDKYGEFFTPESREPKEKDKCKHRLFLKEINDIIKKYPTQPHL